MYKASYIIAKSLIEREGRSGNLAKFFASIIAIFILIGLFREKLKSGIRKIVRRNKQLERKYENITLARKVYGLPNKSDYSVRDFIDFSTLKYLLGEINDHEAVITKEGIKFLEEYYGFESLARSLEEDRWYNAEFNSADKIVNWLKLLKADEND